MRQSVEIRFCDLCNAEIKDRFSDESHEPSKIVLPLNIERKSSDEYGGHEHTFTTIKDFPVRDICDSCKQKIANFVDTIYNPNKPQYEIQVKERNN